MFAYCNNNPVIAADKNGKWLNVVIGAAVGGLVSGAISAYASYKETGSIDWGSVVINAAVGAIGGGIAATGLGPLVQAGITAAASGAGTLVSELRDNGGICSVVKTGKLGEVMAKTGLSAVVGFGCSLLGTGAGKVVTKGIQSRGEAMIIRGTYRVGCASKNAAKELVKQGKSLVNVARGLSSVAGTVFTLPTSTVMSGV